MKEVMNIGADARRYLQLPGYARQARLQPCRQRRSPSSLVDRLVSALSFVLITFVFTAVHPGAQTTERLGSVTFPTSCAADLQKPFEPAVSLLHSFFCEEAQPQFEDIFKKDPHCAIAPWGEAMSIYHPLWFRWFQPSAATIQHGRELIEQAQKIGAKTEHERSCG
jgi:hypothetical protein